MSAVKVSIGIKNGVYCIMFTQNGELILKEVQKIKDSSVASSTFKSLIYVFTIALRMVRKYLGENNECRHYVFEVNNSTFIKWIDNNFSKDEYQDDFVKMVELLQEIPIRYSIVFAKKPLAVAHAQESQITRGSLSGLDLEVEDLGE